MQSRAMMQRQQQRSGAFTGRRTPACHGKVAVASTPLAVGRRRSLACRAELKPEGAVRAIDVMLKKYDFLSTGMGALCVTGWFWAHGQPPLEALSITAVSTVAALVVNELLFSGNGDSATRE